MTEGMTARAPRIALVGNPNCGKTALFNALTGSRQKVANYPGVTVERKEGWFVTPAGHTVQVLDLPGSYSLRGRSPDEEVTRDVVLGRLPGEAMPDLLLCVLDATNLRLHLRLVIELKQLGRPIVVALNMMDIAERTGCVIDLDALAAALGVPVVPTVAVRKRGIQPLLAKLDEMVGWSPAPAPAAAAWSAPSADTVREHHRAVEEVLRRALHDEGVAGRFTRRLDRIVLHPALGLVILLALLFLMFQAVFTWAETPMDLIESGITALGGWIGESMADGPLRSLLVDGIIAGVGSVLVFLPQIVILFFFILLFEDFGYMARAAFLMDRLMGGVGLHGRAFIPLLSSLACAIPGIMASRVIENRNDRLTTILAAPLMTCSARIPVYTLIIAAFIPNQTVFGAVGLQGLVMFGLYAAGILATVAVAFVLKRTVASGAPEPLIMELPTYKLPNPLNVLRGVAERGWIFLRRAGTVILAMMVVIWFLASFPAAPEGATEPAIHYSLAGQLGHFMEPVLAPIGFNWEIAIALVPGLAAREVAVAALGTIYALGGSEDAVAELLTTTLSQSWTLPTALAFLAWYVFAPQCAATLAVVRRETNSWRWPVFMFVYMLVLAYVAAFVTYRVALLLFGG